MSRSPEEMREQVRGLKGIVNAGLTRSWIGVLLAELLGGSVETWRTQVARACAGSGPMGVGLWRLILLGVDPEEQLAMARAILSESHLRVELETYEPPPDLAEASMDLAEAAIQAARAEGHGAGTAAMHRRIADAHMAIAAGHEQLNDVEALASK